MDRRGGRPAIHNRLAVRPQVVRCDLAQQAVLPLWQNVPIEDGPAHVAGAVRHRRAVHPALGDLCEILSFLQATFGALLFDCGRHPVRDRLLHLDKPLAGLGQRQSGPTVTPERQGLSTAVEAIVVAE